MLIARTADLHQREAKLLNCAYQFVYNMDRYALQFPPAGHMQKYNFVPKRSQPGFGRRESWQDGIQILNSRSRRQADLRDHRLHEVSPCRVKPSARVRSGDDRRGIRTLYDMHV